MCKIGSQWEAAKQHRKPTLLLYDDLGGEMAGGEGSSRGRGYMWCVRD